MRHRSIWILLIAAFAALTFLETKYLRGKRPETEWMKDALILPPAELLRKYSLGFENLFADLLWIRGISSRYNWSDAFLPSNGCTFNDDHTHHHTVERTKSANHPDLSSGHSHGIENRPHYDRPRYPVRYLFEVCNTVTSLDPNYLFPYKITSVILLGEKLHEESITLLLKGMVHHPGNWFFPYFTAINFYFMKDFEKAAHYMRNASALPGCPEGARTLIASFYAQHFDPNVGLRFLLEYYNSIQDRELKDFIKVKIERMNLQHDLHEKVTL
jgi:hypothetical protein